MVARRVWVLSCVVAASACGKVEALTDADVAVDAAGEGVDAAVDAPVPLGPPGTLTMVRSLASMGPYTVRVGGGGHVFIGGAIQEEVDLGGGRLKPFGEYDGCLVELAADGGHVASSSFGDVGGEFPFLGDIAADGALVVHGVSYGEVNLGRGTVGGGGGTGADAFVGVYGLRGAPPWVKRIATAEEDKFLATAAGPGSTVFATGYFVGGATIDNSSVGGIGGRDIMLFRFGQAGGDVVLARSWGTAARDEGTAVQLAGNRVVLAGIFEGTLDFGAPTQPLRTAGGTDAFVVAMGVDGSPVWALRGGGGGAEGGPAMDLDADGNVYLTGAFAGEAGFGALNLTSKGPTDAYVVKVATDGKVAWARSFGGVGDESPSRVAVAPDGTVFVVGWASDDVAPGDNVPHGGKLDAFVASFDGANGGERWVRTFGTTGDDRAWAVDADGGGQVYVTINTATPFPWPMVPSGPADPTAVLLRMVR